MLLLFKNLSVQALLKEDDYVGGYDHLAIAWECPNQAREVIPATFSRVVNC